MVGTGIGQVVATACAVRVTVYVLVTYTVVAVDAEETVRVVVPEARGVTVLRSSQFKFS
jgi:hypothetical protein